LHIQTFTWEITGAANVNFSGTHTGGVNFNGQQLSDDSNTQRFALSGSASYFVLRQLEATVTAAFINTAPSQYFSPTLNLRAGPTFNFSSDVQNSFFVTGQLGLSYSHSTNDLPSVTRLSYFTGFGKRFEIVDRRQRASEWMRVFRV
jgi:hypothetical protein